MEEEDDYDKFSIDDEEDTEYDDDGIDDDDDESTNILGEQHTSQLVDYTETYTQYKIGVKETKPFINKFERIKIISIRAQQLANGAKSTISIPNGVSDVSDIATLEYEAKKIPFMIRRFKADNTYEDWRLNDFVNIKKSNKK